MLSGCHVGNEMSHACHRARVTPAELGMEDVADAG